MATFYNLSALDWVPFGAEYFNLNRQLSSTNVLVGVSGQFIETPVLTGINDVIINHDTLFYLSDRKVPSDMFSNQTASIVFSNSAYPLSADTFNLGTTGSSSFVDYYNCPDTPTYNKTLRFKTTIDDVNINHIIFTPFKTQYRFDDVNKFQFNFFNLKNIMTPHYEYDSCISNGPVNREYTKMYLGTNQDNGYNDLFLGYTASTHQLKFPTDAITYFHYPFDGDTLYNLTTACLIENGAIAGDAPMNSDILGMDQYGYNLYTPSGPISNNRNGTFLCAWLSGDNACGNNYKWMERWYDPNTVTQGDAYITNQNSSSCINIWDVNATITVAPKVRYFYNRFGSDRNLLSVNSISGDLVLHYDSWGTSLEDNSSYNNDGHIFEKYKGSSTEFELDGSNYGYVPTTDSILSTSNQITVSVAASKDAWCCGKNAQIVGNYHFGGWGLFYNTGMDNHMITIGDNTGFVHSYNINGSRIFEKNVESSDLVNNVSFDYIANDLNGSRWVLDTHNNKLYKIDVDDLLLEIVNYPPSYKLTKLQISSYNEIYVLDTNNDKVFVHDENGTYVETIIAPSSATNYEIDLDGSVVFSNGDYMLVDSTSNIFKVLGSNLYKNDSIYFNFSTTITDIKIDESDTLWVAYKGNHLMKINSDGELVFDIAVTEFLQNEKRTRIGITRESDSSGCDVNRIWMVFENNSRIVKLDTNGNVLKIINVLNDVHTKRCDSFTIRALGDFTGFDIKRKFNITDGNFITPKNPAFTLRVKFKNACNVKLYKISHLPICDLPAGYHVIGFSFNSDTGQLKFFIDGVSHTTEYLDAGKWSIDYNDVTPIIIGGNSGKLGSENEEKGITITQYWSGKIDDVRVYNKELSPYLMKNISDIKLSNFEELVWNVPISTKSYIEKIERFFMNKKPGHTSKYFNIKINGLSDIDSDLKSLIESSIESSIDKIIPAYVEIKDIVWN